MPVQNFTVVYRIACCMFCLITVDLDLESQEASFRPERRHSITVCKSPERPQGSKTTMQVNGKSPSGSSTRSTISGSFSPRVCNRCPANDRDY